MSPQSHRCKDRDAAFDALPDMISVIDPQHKITYCNRAMRERLAAIGIEDPVGRLCYECIHGACYVPNCPHTLTLRDGQTHTRTVQEGRLGGYFLVTTAPLQGDFDKLTGTIHIMRDITEIETNRRKYEIRLRLMVTELMAVEEKERKKLASALHDKAGQNLSLAIMLLKSCLNGVAASPLRITLEEVLAAVQRANLDTRNITYELSVPVLYDLGLGKALEWLADQYTRKTMFRVSVECPWDIRSDPPEGERMALFRSVQELLHNAAKYAQANEVRITATQTNDAISIEVADNGIGMPTQPDGAPPASGHGLFTIRERITAMNGTMTVCSPLGKGTSITLQIPVRSAPPPPPKPVKS